MADHQPMTPQPMTPQRFWSIIDWSRALAERSHRDAELADLAQAQAHHATELLTRLKAAEIAAFRRFFDDRMAESYRRELWAVASIAHGGCSDDGFDYFRAWLIGQGHEYYEAALADPERAADRIHPDDVAENEALLHSADEAYEHETGKELPPSPDRTPPQLVGAEWTPDDLPELYPALSARFDTGEQAPGPVRSAAEGRRLRSAPARRPGWGGSRA
jgi:hypothetical protein